MLDLVSIHKGVGISVAIKKMVINAQATLEDVRQKFLDINSKYKEVADRHTLVKYSMNKIG